jgi:hypothetical protein
MNQLILTIILVLALNLERPEEKIQKKELVGSSDDAIKVSQTTQALGEF